jgi:hypothetical protein
VSNQDVVFLWRQVSGFDKTSFEVLSKILEMRGATVPVAKLKMPKEVYS